MIQKKKYIIKFLSSTLILVLLLTGCFNQPKPPINDLDPYIVLKEYDFSLPSTKRLKATVYLRDFTNDIQLIKEYANEIISRYNNTFKGVQLYFYDFEQEAQNIKNKPMAIASWGPHGLYKEAINFKEYKADNYKVSVEKSKLTYIPTKEDRNLYKKYLENKDLPAKKLIKKLGFSTEKKLNEFIEKMIYRYNS